MDLNNKTVLITGGTSGIGLAFARKLIAVGSKVIICGRSPEKLNQIKHAFPEVQIYACDVVLKESRHALVKDIKDDGHEVDVLLNNAGILNPVDLQYIEGRGFQSINDEVATNLIAPIDLIDLFLGELLSKKEAAIINVGSPAGVIPIAQTPGYSLSKAGLHSFSQTLRYQLKDSAVKVIEVFPPSVETKMAEHNGRKNMDCDRFAKKALAKIARGKSEIWIGEAYIVRMFAKLPRVFSFNLINSRVPIIKQS